jgi:hypothetical protein
MVAVCVAASAVFSQAPRQATQLAESLSVAQSLANSDLARLYATARSGAPPQTLVVPAADAEPAELAKIIQDMAIMSRILDKALGRESLATRSRLLTTYGQALSQLALVDVDGRLAGLPGQTQGVFLESYGALFLITVDFPLAAPAKKDKEEDKDPQTIWEKTKRELYGPGRSAATRAGNVADSRGAHKKYDAKRVEELTEALLESLENAANIRVLKPSDTVAIAVLGEAARPTALVQFGGAFTEQSPANVLTWGLGAVRRTVLVIRAKKSDVDALAKGDMSLDELRKTATILTY